MAPSSYATDYIEYLSRQGKFIATEGSEALKVEVAPAPTQAPVPSRTAVRKTERKARERNESLMVTQKPLKIITAPVLLRTSMLLVIIGVLLISSVWMSAKATSIKYSINSMTRENVKLQDEITMLGIKIEGAVSFESIEDYATHNLKMVYPKKNQCFYIDEDQKVDKHLAEKIREKAYKN
ncbi:MAG: hypothetical protein II918_05010 [Firmicutes bacterium]|jgi:hypothetical protein|nr:hypothetical protein [Bacillota bacterium]